MTRGRERGAAADRPWYDNWWAGVDPSDGSWREPPNASPLSKSDRDRARRWAARTKPRGGWLRRLLG